MITNWKKFLNRKSFIPMSHTVWWRQFLQIYTEFLTQQSKISSASFTSMRAGSLVFHMWAGSMRAGYQFSRMFPYLLHLEHLTALFWLFLCRPLLLLLMLLVIVTKKAVVVCCGCCWCVIIEGLPIEVAIWSFATAVVLIVLTIVTLNQNEKN